MSSSASSTICARRSTPRRPGSILIEKRLEAIATALTRETKLAADDPALAAHVYVDLLRGERARLGPDRAAVEARLARLREQAAEAFGALRTIEAAAAEYRSDVERVLANAEQSVLDDMAATATVAAARARDDRAARSFPAGAGAEGEPDLFGRPRLAGGQPVAEPPSAMAARPPPLKASPTGATRCRGPVARFAADAARRREWVGVPSGRSGRQVEQPPARPAMAEGAEVTPGGLGANADLEGHLTAAAQRTGIRPPCSPPSSMLRRRRIRTAAGASIRAIRAPAPPASASF